MRVDEQRRATAVPAQDFEQPAVFDLRELQAADRLGQARAQNAQAAQPLNHLVGNASAAIDGDGVHLAQAVVLQLTGEFDRGIARAAARVGKELILQVLAEVEPLGETDALQAVAQDFLGF
jgi:hypothetical protein